MGLHKRSMPDLTIEPVEPRNNTRTAPVNKVIEHGVYESGSVLEGLPKRTYVDCYLTLEEAAAAHPTAEVLNHSTKEQGNPLPEVAPDWFDPTYAGERWNEDY